MVVRSQPHNKLRNNVVEKLAPLIGDLGKAEKIVDLSNVKLKVISESLEKLEIAKLDLAVRKSDLTMFESELTNKYVQISDVSDQDLDLLRKTRRDLETACENTSDAESKFYTKVRDELIQAMKLDDPELKKMDREVDEKLQKVREISGEKRSLAAQQNDAVNKLEAEIKHLKLQMRRYGPLIDLMGDLEKWRRED